jgi:hypothetical protein
MFGGLLGDTPPARVSRAVGILLLYGVSASDAARLRPIQEQICPASSVLRVPSNDRLTRDHLVRAVTGSPTARELVARIELLNDTVLLMRAHPLLVRQEGLLGRGKFWIVRGRLFGLLEYQAEPLGSYRALRIVSDELAHALEVGLAPRAYDTRNWRPLLLATEREEVRDAPGIETEFARAVGYRVQLELLGRLKGPSSLAAIADQTHLALGTVPSMALPGWLTAPQTH